MPNLSFHLLQRGVTGIFIVLVVLLQATNLHAGPPILTSMFPGGGQRGTKVTVTCTGGFPCWPVKVWSPGLEITPAKESGKLDITIPADLAVDRAWVRLYNAEGASDAVPFLVDGIKEITELEPNDTPKTAQVIKEASVIINATLAKTADVDCFAIKVEAGQTLVAHVDANDRLGSPMDAILQILSSDGFVLQENHDNVHLDPQLVFKAPKTDTYILRVMAFSSSPDTSINFSSGANFVYRLTLTTGPFVTHAVPLSAHRDKPGVAELFGWNLPAKTTAPIVPLGGSKVIDFPECEVLSDLRLPSESRLGIAILPGSAGAARIRLTSHPALSAIAPHELNDVRDLPVPASVTGLLRTPYQTDTYRIQLKKGQTLVASVETRSIYFGFTPVIQLKDSSGTAVARADNIGPYREAMITYSVPKDGEYQVKVFDRFKNGGDRFFYRLTLYPEVPDFELSAPGDKIEVNPTKPTELAIKVQRRGPGVGPITIQMVNLPPGMTCPLVISEPTGPTATTVTLKLSTIGPAFSGPIRILGKATQPVAIERLVRTPPRLGAVFESLWLTVLEKNDTKPKK